MPWKNGGGETTEIIVSPADASLDTFDWRISMARVAADGPFSVFPGIDRTLSILDGAGIRLAVNGLTQSLTVKSSPLAFPADAPTEAWLLDGAITDLNVMSRRATYRHTVERFHLAGHKLLPAAGAAQVVFCENGTVEVSDASMTVTLNRRDALVCHGETLRIAAAQTATVFAITLYAL